MTKGVEAFNELVAALMCFGLTKEVAEGLALEMIEDAKERGKMS